MDVGAVTEASLLMNVSVLVFIGLSDYESHRGPYEAYLGSNKSESIGILTPCQRNQASRLKKSNEALYNLIPSFQFSTVNPEKH